MRIPRLYHPEPISADAELNLNNNASAHISRVLRLQVNDEVVLFDGQGRSARARLLNTSAKSCTVHVLQILEDDAESPLCIELGLGVSKGDRMDYAIQKAVETGVTRIVPLMTERTVVKLDPKREEKRLEHWQGIVIAACEQSGRNTLPELLPLMSMHEWISRPGECKIVFDPLAEISLAQLSAPTQVNVLVGAEGGLTNDEVNLALHHDFQRIRLGPRILRTETAAVVACGVMQMLWGDYR